MIFEYDPKGVCSRHYKFDISDDNRINSVTILGGCNGNLQGIRNLITGMDIDTVIEKFEGVNCNGKGTSCPDQISKALKQFKESKN